MVQLRRLAVLLGFAIVNLYSAFETFDDFDARARAIANANASLPVSASVIVANPALLTAIPKSLLQVSFLPRGVGLVDTADSPMFNASAAIVANLKKAGSLGLAVNALWVTSEGSTSYSEYQVAVGYGLRFGKMIGVGLTAVGQYWTLGANPFNPLPADIGNTTQILPTINLTAGVHFSPYDQLSVGFVGKNLLHFNLALARPGSTNTDYVNRSAVLGLSYSIDRFVLAMDAEFVVDTSQVNLKFGGETWFAQRRVHVGVGFEMQGPTRGLVPSAGVGVNLGPFVIDYAFALPLNLPGIGNHMVTMTFIVP